MKINRLIETVAAHAWPGEVVKKYGDWLLRANNGVTKRANSVLTVGEIPERKNWLIEIETFYEEKNIRPCFYITESTPEQLDQLLAKNNYKIDTELNILVNDTDKLIGAIEENDRFQISIVNDVTSDWITSFLTLEEHDLNQREAFETIFQGICLPKGFLAICLHDEIVAVATIATEHGWGYISNVVVSEQYRRQGIASQLLFQLAKWASEHDTKNVFMQVLADNEPALRLYEKLGFKKLARSHYRMKI